MITKPTVLVLGAGVSFSYGYPSGAGLVEDIVSNRSSNPWRQIYSALGITIADVEKMVTELFLSQQPSIDAFLEHRPEFLAAGKISIAISLLSKEILSALFDFDARGRGIYQFLFNSLNTSWQEFSQNRLSIVTFNYDRSLEHFLFTALKNSYNRSDEETAEAINSIPIIHVHGSLGPLPWQMAGGQEYEILIDSQWHNRQDANAKRIKIASDNIIIVSEVEPTRKEFGLAHDILAKADRIYFLGFGYFKVNLERLGLLQFNNFDISFKSSPPTTVKHGIDSSGYWDGSGIYRPFLSDGEVSLKHYRGSAMGLGAAQMQAIQNEWRIGLPDNKCNALEFLKEYADLS